MAYLITRVSKEIQVSADFERSKASSLKPQQNIDLAPDEVIKPPKEQAID